MTVFRIVPFKTAEIGLSKFMTMPPQKAFDTLNRIVALSDLARAVKHLKKPIMLGMEVDIRISRKSDVEKLDRKILQLLGRLFPVDEDYMLDYQGDGESIFEHVNHLPIVTEFVGWYTSWDEINDQLYNGEVVYSQDMSVPILVGAYMNDFDDGAWEIFNTYFGWGVPYPEMRPGYQVDLAKVYRMIDQSKEIKFDSSYIAAVCMDTGLAFFDWNPYSEDPDEPPFAWSYKTMIELAQQWEKAKKIVDRIPYNLKVAEDSNQLKLLLEIFRKCETKGRL